MASDYPCAGAHARVVAAALTMRYPATATITPPKAHSSKRQQILSSTYAVEERHVHVFNELLRRRAELAELVGYPSFGHKVLQNGK